MTTRIRLRTLPARSTEKVFVMWWLSRNRSTFDAVTGRHIDRVQNAEVNCTARTREKLSVNPRICAQFPDSRVPARSWEQGRSASSSRRSSP